MQTPNFSKFIAYLNQRGYALQFGNPSTETGQHATEVFIDNKPVGWIYQSEIGGFGMVYFRGRLPDDIHPKERKDGDIELFYDYGYTNAGRHDAWDKIPFP